MTFWSSQKLEGRLGDLIKNTSEALIDCNAITLRVGPEVYITPTLDDQSMAHTKAVLNPGEPFAIPPGQFAFILTEEVVAVPAQAMAFINMKASFKLRGLLNVSGFHVDPGWTGRLIFQVFNAGPVSVHLQRGLPIFLIWYADLDQKSEKHKNGSGPDTIPPQMINNISGSLSSFHTLAARLGEAEKKNVEETKKLSDRIHDIEKTQRTIIATLTLIGTLVFGIVSTVILSQLGR